MSVLLSDYVTDLTEHRNIGAATMQLRDYFSGCDLWVYGFLSGSVFGILLSVIILSRQF